MKVVKVSSKRRQGVVCTYRGCNQPTVTAYFKRHFVRYHLDGDESRYTTAHRDQYEIARSEDPQLEAVMRRIRRIEAHLGVSFSDIEDGDENDEHTEDVPQTNAVVEAEGSDETVPASQEEEPAPATAPTATSDVLGLSPEEIRAAKRQARLRRQLG